MSASELRGIRSISTGLPLPTERAQTPDAGFKDLLKDETVTGQNPAAKTEAAKLQFSNHAVDRMRSRGISMEPADVERLGQAIEKAQAKGSRETLVLMGDNAFIVNVKNKTVVTAMDRQMMKENVFTNIDSTVIL